MTSVTTKMSRKQLLFREMVLGTLVYSLVLGFFADYTDTLIIGTQSTIFAAAIVVEILTLLTFELKNIVVARIKDRHFKYYLPIKYFSVWLIMFFSKFVFLWVIDIIFGTAVEIRGFVALLLMIITMTLVKLAIDKFYQKLAD